MAETEAIPDEIFEQAHNVYIAARLLARGGPCKAGEMIWHPISVAIHAAELRGRAQQKEADARIAETLIPNGKLKSQQVAHVCGHRIAHTIRNQTPDFPVLDDKSS